MKVVIPVSIGVFIIAFLLSGKFANREHNQTAIVTPSLKEIQMVAVESQDKPATLTLKFKWSAVESDDFQKLIANLRGVECPEATIIDITEGRLKAKYRPRFRFALASAFRMPANIQMQQRMSGVENLKQEIDHTLYAELGLQRQPRSAGVLFTADEEQKIAEARQRFEPIQVFDPANTNLLATSQSNVQARIDYLSKYLSPEKLLLYKLDREGGGQSVNGFFEGYRSTESQFMTLAKALDNASLSLKFYNLTPEAEAALQPILPQDLFNLLKDLRRSDIGGVMVFGRMHNIQAEILNKLVDARRTLTKDNAAVYLQNLKTYLVQPDLVESFLANKQIHPDTLLQ